MKPLKTREVQQGCGRNRWAEPELRFEANLEVELVVPCCRETEEKRYRAQR